MPKKLKLNIRKDSPITARSVIITTCTNRKRHQAEQRLQGRDLAPGTVTDVANAWKLRLHAATVRRPVSELYCGRAFTEATRAAAAVDAELLIVSAGLGLVSQATVAPSYDLTLTTTSADSILSKIDGDAAAWWTQIEASIAPAPDLDSAGPILAALSRPYLTMVAAAWAEWPAQRLTRLRLFSKERPVGISKALAQAWMPYDDRLDQAPGAYAGTQSDFAQRALRHFVDTLGRAGGDVENDRDAVATAMAGLEHRNKPIRERFDDDEITLIIRRDWDLVAGRSGAMLRRLRDDLAIACEQTRFKNLFKAVAAARQGALP